MEINNKHTEKSSFREKLIEHLFIGELLKLSWKKENCEIEISKPEVDNSGYDLIAEVNGIIRHIQLKSTYIGGKNTKQKIQVKLGQKPSGCVIWIYFKEENLDLGPFYFLGSEIGEPLFLPQNAKIAKHSKGDMDGHKAHRPNLRVINKGEFKKIDSIESLYDILCCKVKKP